MPIDVSDNNITHPPDTTPDDDTTPLLQSLLHFETIRTEQLLAEGSCQRNYPKSSDGWIKTIFVWEGRALDLIALPFVVLVLHATIYTLITKLWLHKDNREMDSWEIFFSLVINTTLSFLLVFRLYSHRATIICTVGVVDCPRTSLFGLYHSTFRSRSIPSR